MSVYHWITQKLTKTFKIYTTLANINLKYHRPTAIIWIFLRFKIAALFGTDYNKVIKKGFTICKF